MQGIKIAITEDGTLEAVEPSRSVWQTEFAPMLDAALQGDESMWPAMEEWVEKHYPPATTMDIRDHRLFLRYCEEDEKRETA